MREVSGQVRLLEPSASQPRSSGAKASSVGLGASSSTQPSGLKETRPNSKGQTLSNLPMGFGMPNPS
jgi:hypothetical protein